MTNELTSVYASCLCFVFTWDGVWTCCPRIGQSKRKIISVELREPFWICAVRLRPKGLVSFSRKFLFASFFRPVWLLPLLPSSPPPLLPSPLTCCPLSSRDDLPWCTAKFSKLTVKAITSCKRFHVIFVIDFCRSLEHLSFFAMVSSFSMLLLFFTRYRGLPLNICLVFGTFAFTHLHAQVEWDITFREVLSRGTSFGLASFRWSTRLVPKLFH